MDWCTEDLRTEAANDLVRQPLVMLEIQCRIMERVKRKSDLCVNLGEEVFLEIPFLKQT